MATYLLAGLIFLLAALLHGVCGFGFSMFSVGMLSLLLGPRTAVPLDLVVASFNCFYLAWLMRKSILYKETLLLVVLTFIFVPVGTLYLRHVDSAVIMKTMGAVIVMVALISLLRAEHLRVFSSKVFQYIAGITGGLLGGAFNMPGPPLVVYAFNCHWPLVNAKANLQFIFSAMTLITYVSFAAAGLLTVEIVGWGLVYAPLVLGFTFVGNAISRRIKVGHLAFAINLLMAALGITLIVRS